MAEWTQVQGKIVKGHQVASGQNNDPTFPGGTLRMQHTAFAQLGLDLSPYFTGTLNLSIHPHTYTLHQSVHTFRSVQWAAHRPAEDFSFFDCRLRVEERSPFPGLVYYPHPDTKPMHFQDPSVLELLLPFIDGLNYGDTIILELKPEQITVK